VDHIVPLAEGGAEYDLANLATLCGPHHDAKTKADAARGRARGQADRARGTRNIANVRRVTPGNQGATARNPRRTPRIPPRR